MFDLYKRCWLGLCLIALVTAGGNCKKHPDFSDIVLITGTESSNILTFPVDGTPSEIALTATSTTLAGQDIEVAFQTDTSLVKAYNAEFQTNFYPLPQADYSLTATTATIKNGTNVSEPIKITVNSLDSTVDGRNYMIPVDIQVKSGGLRVLPVNRTAFLKIIKVIHTSVVSLDPSYGQYFQYDFKDTLQFSAFTVEVRMNAAQFGTNFAINNLIAFEGYDKKGQANFNLFRFGELSGAINQLQWINGDGKVTSNTFFAANTWYHIAFVYDGANCNMYVNGKLDCTFPDAAKNFNLDRIYFGNASEPLMAQLSELRFWSRALSPAELINGMCAVDPASPGLEMYYKMNEGTGNTLTDYSGHGRALVAPGDFTWVAGIKCPE